MPLLWIILILFWIVIVIFAWFYIRKHKPEWIGLGENLNDQKIDGVRYKICPECSEGTLEPKFHWWQHCIGISLPPGIIYIAGNPHSFVCSKCSFITKHADKKRLFTRISLTQKLSKEFFIGLGVNIFVGLIAIAIWFSI